MYQNTRVATQSPVGRKDWKMAKDLQFTFRRPCLEICGEVGSLTELIGYMQEESATLTLAFGDDMELVVQRINGATGEPASQQGGEVATAAEGKAPRKPRTPKDPVVAVAPAPMPIPALVTAPTTATLPPNALNAAPPAAPAAPSLAIPADGGIPPFLARTAEAAAPPLPTVPSAPIAAAPTPPPVGVLGPKIVAALDLKKAASPESAKLLADWLADCKLTVPGATYDEACQALLFMGDGKLAGVAERLGIA